jgi:soluble lytic murein transglycosylase-like protein
MYFRAKDVAALLLLASMAVANHYSIQAPKPIAVKPITEEQIKEGVKLERRKKATERGIARATAAARTVYRANGCRDVYSVLTGRIAYEYGISGRLLAAVVFVESSCRSNAVSGRDGVGLAQINYHVWRQHSKQEYMDPEVSLRTGAAILSGYIKRYGLEEGLHAYNGFGNPTSEYGDKVLLIAGLRKEN